jgi:hypothetical protein
MKMTLEYKTAGQAFKEPRKKRGSLRANAGLGIRQPKNIYNAIALSLTYLPKQKR